MSPPASAPPEVLENRIVELEREIAALRDRIAKLERTLAGQPEHSVDRRMTRSKVAYDWQS